MQHQDLRLDIVVLRWQNFRKIYKSIFKRSFKVLKYNKKEAILIVIIANYVHKVLNESYNI